MGYLFKRLSDWTKEKGQKLPLSLGILVDAGGFDARGDVGEHFSADSRANRLRPHTNLLCNLGVRQVGSLGEMHSGL